eukprot:Skav219541  [mRNA]  locus=scaffold556:85157:86998:- [translate_table: standard]
MPMAGGVGAKNEHRQFIHTELASMMMENGISMHDVPPCVEQVIKHAGLPKLTHVICNLKPDDRTNQIRAMCEHLNIPWPKQSIHRAQKKFQKLSKQRQSREIRNIDPSHYHLQPGFFVTEQGEEAKIHTSIVPGSSGVVMTTPDKAAPWLSQPAKCSPDAFALFIVGNLPHPNESAVKLTVPATNLQGEVCLLAGWLVQMGDAKITVSTQQLPTVQTNDVHSCAFTQWSQDFDPETWQQVVKSPVRSARKLLEQDGDSDIMMSPHGRTYRCDNQPCPPEKATSVQFHAEVKVTDLRAALRRSGFNRLYITPKDDQGKVSPLWRVIWLPHNPEMIQVKSAAQPAAAGLVKGRQGYGLRVEAKHFAELWKILCPGQDPPNHQPEGQVWKVHPLPAGVDRAVLLEWAKSYDWDITPTRPLGQKAWLFTAVAPPQPSILYFNGPPLILKRMERPNQTPQVGLIAGPPSKLQAPQSNAASLTEKSAFKLGDPFYDPWKPASSSEAKPMHTTVSGPTQTHLEQHDKQLLALEAAVQKIQENQEQQEASAQTRFAQIETQVQKNHHDTQQAFHNFQVEFERSLSKAMSEQDRRITSGMEELKQLFLRNEKRKAENSDEML